MIRDIYSESWGVGNELKGKIKKWYKETKEKYKILVAFCGQSRNKAKTEWICEAIESQIRCPLKENVVKILNEQGPWVAIYVGTPMNIKALTKISTLYIPDHRDLISF